MRENRLQKRTLRRVIKLKTRELPVSFFELQVIAKFKGHEAIPVPPQPLDLLTICRSAERSPMQSGTVRRVVEDWELRQGQHTLLVNRADTDRTDVAMVNFNNGRRRTAGKQADDGIEYSCHILIDPPKAGRHLPLLLATGGAGMSREQIELLLNALTRRAAQDPANAEFFQRPHPDGTAGKHLKLLCTFQVLPYQSLLLTDVLARGLLQEVQLISHESQNLDQNFVQKAHSVTIGIAQEGVPLSLSALRNAFAATRVNPDKLLLKFNDPDSGKPTSKTIAFNALEQAMTMRDVLTFDEDLMPCYSKISREIVRKMQGHL